MNVRIKYPVSDLHTDTGVDRLTIRYDLQLLLLIYKYMYDTSHKHTELGLDFHIPNSEGRITRSAGTGVLKYPPSIKGGYRRSPLYRGVDLWNNMNTSCRLASSKDMFRAKARSKLLELYMLKLKQ